MSKNPHKKIKKSYKGFFPFRLATTSFIYRDGYESNVEMLGPCFDEIELLFFESRDARSFPSESTIRELRILADTFDLTYNVHLPLDIFLGSSSRQVRRRGIDVIKRVMDLTRPLLPTTHTLHLTWDKAQQEHGTGEIKSWQDRCSESMATLLSQGVEREEFTIENLNYPFEWAEPVIKRFNLNVCLDTGHMMVQGLDPRSAYLLHREKIKLIHLHGVKGKKDHIALNLCDRKKKDQIARLLDGFMETVSIEVFSFADLEPSLIFLEKICPHPLERSN